MRNESKRASKIKNENYTNARNRKRNNSAPQEEPLSRYTFCMGYLNFNNLITTILLNSEIVPSCCSCTNHNYDTHSYSGGLRDVRCAFWKALFSTVGWPLIYALALKYLSVALFLANPLLLRLVAFRVLVP